MDAVSNPLSSDPEGNSIWRADIKIEQRFSTFLFIRNT